jgi:hypothetical protein
MSHAPFSTGRLTCAPRSTASAGLEDTWTVPPDLSVRRATPDSLRHELEALRAREAERRAENHWLREAVARKRGQDRADSAR